MTLPPPQAPPAPAARVDALAATDLVVAAAGVLAFAGGFLPYERYHDEGFSFEYKGFLSAPESVLIAMVIGVLAASMLGRRGRLSRWLLAGLAGVFALVQLGKLVTFDSQHGQDSHAYGFWLIVAAAAVQTIAAVVGGLVESGYGISRPPAMPPAGTYQPESPPPAPPAG